MEMNYVFVIIIIILLIIIYQNTMRQKEQTTIDIQPVEVITETKTESPLPYWVWYGQPWYTPVYMNPYWLYDAPFYGPITGGSYGHHTRPGRGHPGPAMGGSTGVAHGGGGGHGGH
jgi:hypothetical protein